MTARVVLAPELGFAELAAVVEAAGWDLVSEPSLPPLVPGEPEFATWQAPDRGTLVYSCNPAAWLRVLDLSGVPSLADRGALLARLPLFDERALPALLRAGEAHRVLLGVLAADALGAQEHLDALRALTHHGEAAIASVATRVVANLLAAG